MKYPVKCAMRSDDARYGGSDVRIVGEIHRTIVDAFAKAPTKSFEAHGTFALQSTAPTDDNTCMRGPGQNVCGDQRPDAPKSAGDEIDAMLSVRHAIGHARHEVPCRRFSQTVRLPAHQLQPWPCRHRIGPGRERIAIDRGRCDQHLPVPTGSSRAIVRNIAARPSPRAEPSSMPI